MLNSFLNLSPRARACLLIALLIVLFVLTACFDPER
jgi:hypothetical protein